MQQYEEKIQHLEEVVQEKDEQLARQKAHLDCAGQSGAADRLSAELQQLQANCDELRRSSTAVDMTLEASEGVARQMEAYAVQAAAGCDALHRDVETLRQANAALQKQADEQAAQLREYEANQALMDARSEMQSLMEATDKVDVTEALEAQVSCLLPCTC